MRYLNWDVLLFATSSETKAPLQEYRTVCGVTDDPSMLHPTKTPFQMEVSYIPLVTSFVPSLPEGSGFKVSVHSWTAPTPSTICQSMMLDGDSAWFEARVYIDGRFVSGSMYNELTTWPQPIDESNFRDRHGNVDMLKFPAFHNEVLTQKTWLATETNGRIRVIIAEGICRRHGIQTMVPVKDVIAFSFQHAPQNILENAGIAWPNPGMWHPVPPRLLKPNTASGNPYLYHWDAASHTHFSPMPTRVGPGAGLDAQYSYQGGFNGSVMGPPASIIARSRQNNQSITMEDADFFGAPGPSMRTTRTNRQSMSMEDADPFLDFPTGLSPRRDYTLSSNDDVTMLSRSASGRTRLASDMSGISFEQRAPAMGESDVSAVDYETAPLVVEQPTVLGPDAPFQRGQETFAEYLLRVSPVQAPPMAIPAQAPPGPAQSEETFEAFLRRVSPPKAPQAPPMGIWTQGKATGELLAGFDIETPRMTSVPKQTRAISPYLSTGGSAYEHVGVPADNVKGRKEGKLPEATESSPTTSLVTSTNRRTGSLTKKANGTLGASSDGKRKLSWGLGDGKENESGLAAAERKILRVKVSETGSPEPESDDEDDDEFEDEETEALKEALAVVDWDEGDIV